jgi:hypothetical protein
MAHSGNVTEANQGSGTSVQANTAAGRAEARLAATASAREMRWAGTALTLGATLFVLGTVLGLEAFEGEWDTSIGPTLPETAALIQERWPRFRAIWSGEMLGALLMAVGALLLQRRPQASARWLPAGVVWTVVGIGSVLVAVSYGLTLGGYPAALATFQDQPALFATLRGCVLFLHAVGSVLQLLGVLGALVTEVRWRGTALPDRLLQVGAGVGLLSVVAPATGLVAGVYGASALFLAAVLLGAAIWIRPVAPAVAAGGEPS